MPKAHGQIGASIELQKRIADAMTYPSGSMVDGQRVKRPLRELGNVVVALQRDPLYAVTYNTFAGRVEIDGRALTDEDETRIALELGTSYGLVVPTRGGDSHSDPSSWPATGLRPARVRPSRISDCTDSAPSASQTFSSRLSG